MAKTLPQLYSVVTDCVLNNRQHEDYKHVTKLASDYRAFMTGIGTEKMLEQFNLRETDDQFTQRKRLTTLVTQSIVARLTNPERKIAGIKPTVRRFGYEKTRAEEQAKKMEELVKAFYGRKGVDMFLKDVFMNMYDSDPNGFLLYLMSDFEGALQDPVVYASIVTSEMAVDYEYLDHALQYLVVKRKIEYPLVATTNNSDKPPTMKKGAYLSGFNDNDQLVFQQVDEKTISAVGAKNELVAVAVDGSAERMTENGVLPEGFVPSEGVKYFFMTRDNRLFAVRFLQHLSKRVPAFRVGNIPDVATYNRTMVNVWHEAMPYLRKTVKTVSELDISESLHVFPQEFVYQPKCLGTVQGGVPISCINGRTPDDKVCQSCGGTGLMRHTSTQDTITLGMPKNPDEMFDLTKLKAYATVPIDIVKWLDEHADKLEEKCIKSVYGSDIYLRDTTAKTATEKLTEEQAQYDALSPMAQQYSYGWKFTVEQNAIYKELSEGLTVEHVFPHNFRFESEGELIERIKAAKDAGVSDYVLSQMNDDLIALIYTDQPDLLKEIRTKKRFNPFDGKSDGTVLSLSAQGMAPDDDFILWANSKRIIMEAAEQAKGKGAEQVSFYDLPYAQQKKMIDAAVATLKDTLQKQTEAKALSAGEQPPTG